MKIIKKFFSRRNEVVLAKVGNDNKIVKTFYNKDNCINEYNTLKKLAILNVPKVYEMVDDSLYLEYIDGELFVDEFLKADMEMVINLAKMQANFIKEFRKIFPNSIPNDENFRNYILSNNQLFRIDLEQTEEGSLEKFLAQIMAFATLYKKDCNETIEFIRTLIVQFDFNISDLKKEYLSYLTFLAKRWQVEFPTKFYNVIIDLCFS